MAQCQHCAAKTQLFLCNPCTAELLDTLHSLYTTRNNGRIHYGLLSYLNDAAIGQVKLGDNGKHARREPDGLGKYTDTRPHCDEWGPTGLTVGQERLQRHLAEGKLGLDKALAAGRVNARAARLATQWHATLATWCRDICETRGIAWMPLRTTGPAFIGPLLPGWRRIPPGYTATSEEMAAWLARHVTAIATHPDAGLCYQDIATLTARTETVINRRILPRLIGPCPMFDDKGDRCMQELRAPRDQSHVKCPKCHVTQEVRSVIQGYLMRNRHKLFTLKELETVLERIEEPVSLRTLQRWRKNGQLKARGYWRPDDQRGTMRRTNEDTPGFWIDDARKLRAASPRMQDTAS